MANTTNTIPLGSASWGKWHHITNAALWGIVGAYAMSAGVLGGIPRWLELAVMAAIFSYGTDMLVPYEKQYL